MSDRIDAIIQLPSGEWLQFSDPARLVVSESPATVRPALAEVERLTRDFGLHAVGFLTYEAGAAFGLAARFSHDGIPLLWFGLFEPHKIQPIPLATLTTGTYQLGTLRPTISRAEFEHAFATIKAHLAAGDSYQVNFTFKVAGSFDGDVLSFFADLVEVQRARHCAFIRLGDFAICSASPELFFELDGPAIRARPMKGTARRGLTWAEDQKLRDELRESAKQRAENVMIVDMIRNDLGRIADVGSVTVSDLLTVERYPNVWQMTSQITARSLASLEDIFAAMHPSASVTGAPKVRTMELLNELESSGRGIYTGAIGHVPPDGNARFNVAIRTAVVDRVAKRVEFGIGSGIVWDSDAGAEYDECLLKAAILGRRPPRFDLLETFRWTEDGGYFLLERHLERMRNSAEYFDVPFDREAAVSTLEAAARGFAGTRRVRLLLGRDGTYRAEHSALVSTAGRVRVALAKSPIETNDVWLYHKTTARGVYDQARAEQPTVDEVILWNGAEQLTEATTANIVADVGGRLVTPPVSCGLLEGTFRAELLARGEIVEQVVHVSDLRTALRLWLINSVHEWREAVLG